MKPIAWRPCVSFIAAALILTSCNDEEQTKRVKELETESADRISEIETLSRRLEETETERNKLRVDLDKAQRDATRATDQFADAQRQLESMRKAEQARQESAQVKPAANPVENSKKLVAERLSSVWLVQGDQGSCRGIVAEADGKTWLYLPVSALGGSAKLTVKDAQNNTITKFGDFQVAADANLARLEIKQDVPNRFTIDPKAALGENPAILVASPPDGGGPLKLEDNQPGAINPTDLEFNAYGIKDASGCPLFSAESGALIAIIMPSQAATTGLWQAPQPVESGLPRAARLNRSIDWKPTTIGALLAERRKIDELNKLSKLVEAAAALSPGASGLKMEAIVPGGSQSARQVFDDNKTMPVVQELLKLNENLSGQKMRVSESDIKRQVGSIFGQLGAASRRAATELRAIKTSPIHQLDAENALKWNDEAAKKLAATLAEAGH